MLPRRHPCSPAAGCRLPAAGFRRLAAAAALLLATGAAGRVYAQPVPGSGPGAAVSAAAVADTLPRAARALARGAVLTAADILWPAGAPVPVAGSWKPAAGAARGAVAAGWVTRRTIAEGELLRRPAVEPPPLVHGGDTVQAVWRQGAVELRLRGVALGAAGMGEPVIVRLDARRRFNGTAVGPGRVQIDNAGTR